SSLHISPSHTHTHTHTMAAQDGGKSEVGVNSSPALKPKDWVLLSLRFFVVANGMASFHNCLMIVVELFGHKIDCNGLRLAIIAILDMMTVAMTSAGDGAATFMAEVGKNGNSHARWNKICDKFHAYCDRGNGALIASFIGLLILLIINVMSISKLLKPKHTTYIGVP
ncbi:hypothetical protein F2P56_007287, partial [Juglans regia]